MFSISIVYSHAGFIVTFMLLIADILIGIKLLKRGLGVAEGFDKANIFHQIKDRASMNEVFRSPIFLLAGVLFITPGIVSDIIAIFIIFVPTRHLITIFSFFRKSAPLFSESKLFARKIHKEEINKEKAKFNQGKGQTIEAKFERLDENKKPK
jgi:UPF0716 family protein affecting phage T7 exclusion